MFASLREGHGADTIARFVVEAGGLAMMPTMMPT